MATLYGQAENFRTQKVKAAAAYGNTKLTVKDTEPPADKFPLGLTPALDNAGKAITGDGGILWEVSGKALKGQTEAEAAGIVGWLSLAESEFAPPILGWVLPSVSVLKMDKKAVDAAKGASLDLLDGLETLLVSKTFLVGERLSLADLSLAFNLLPAFQHVLDANARKARPSLTRWFNTVINQPQIAGVIGSVSLCDKPAQFDPKKYAEHEGAAKPKGGKGGKKEGGKKKSESEGGAQAGQAAQAAADGDEPAEPPKKGDPFDKFPKPAFNLDEFKRVYSNEDTETKAIPYLLNNIDWENWSLWKGEYKYPEDLGLVFMSCNLMGGMMQRLDKLRKNAFASVCLFGENNASTITGLWLWRGDELAFTLSPDWQIDYESYAWEKLDPKAPATQTMIKEYLTWEGDFDGKKFNQGKIFK